MNLRPVFMKAIKIWPLMFFVLSVSVQLAFAQKIELVPVLSKAASRTVDLPGEFQPYLTVSLHARVTGFVEKVLVDRGR